MEKAILAALFKILLERKCLIGWIDWYRALPTNLIMCMVCFPSLPVI
jgi:hypothetical protein